MLMLTMKILVSLFLCMVLWVFSTEMLGVDRIPWVRDVTRWGLLVTLTPSVLLLIIAILHL